MRRANVSIVTAVRDAAGTLERAIRSVLAQSHAPIEHIVIDGASTDGTLAVIERYGEHLAYWASEPDRGIADAFNKGLAVARGDLITFLNADDWLSPDQIACAVGALERSGADFVFGDLLYHDGQGRVAHRIRGDGHYAESIAHGMPALNHPTVVARRAVYDVTGGFDAAWRCAMDYDWLLRAHKAGFRGAYEPRIIGHMALGGSSDRGWREALAEVRDISIRHGYPAGRAHARHAWRVAKGGGRRLLERAAPPWLHDGLRRRVNRDFEPPPSGHEHGPGHRI